MNVVLKVYKTVRDTNQILLNDKSLYLPNGNCVGFECLANPLNPKYAKDGTYEKWLYGTPAKYGLLFSDQLETTDRKTIGNSKNEVTTVDGLNWTIERQSAGKEVITIDTDPSSTSRNCSYSEDCKNPDLFIFNVDNLGIVKGADPLTKAYLLNSYKLNDRKKDLQIANDFLIEDSDSELVEKPITPDY